MELHGRKHSRFGPFLRYLNYYQEKILLPFLILAIFFTSMVSSLLNSTYSILNTDIVSNVSEGCSFTSSVTSAHTKTITPGTTQSDIGTTKVTTKCTNSSNHQVYAIGYSNDTDGNTNLINSAANATIATGTATSGNVSNWAMKIAKDSSSYEPSNLTITNSFGSYHTVPSSSTQVSNYEGATDSSTGSSITTTYRAKISDTQVSGSYAGKVKYTLTATMIYNITIKTVTGISKVTLNGVECTSTSGCVISGLTEGQDYELIATIATGYNFASWNIGNYGHIDDSTSASTIYTVGDGNSTITPSVTAKQYTITLNGNGATTAGSSSTKATYGSSTLNAITRPVKQYTVSGFTLPASNNADGADVTSTSTITSSYTFRGWFKESAATNLIASNAATPVLASSTSYTDGNGNWSYDGTRTLYAGWTPQIISLPNITKAGYDCGWTETATNATTKEFQTGASLTPDRNYILYGVCIPIDYTITVNAGAGINTLALSGWTGTGTGTLTKTFHIGDTIDLSTFTPTYLTGHSGKSYSDAGPYGSISGSIFTVGTGDSNITIKASTLATPTCTIQGGATKVYNDADTTLAATSVSSLYESNSVSITYSFGYASSSTGTLGSFSTAQPSNTYSVTKNAFRGTRYYGVKVTVTNKNDSSLTATCTSGTGTNTGSNVANRTTMELVNSRVQLNVGDGALSGTPYFYVYYGGDSATKYTTRTGTISYTLPTVTAPSNYELDGWYTAATGGSKVMNADFSLVSTAVTNWSNAHSQWAKTGTNDSSSFDGNQLYAHYTSTYPVLQNLASSACTTTASQAMDNRDGKMYTIKRLNDGNCWMMENLDLGRTNLTTNLTSSNTNISTAITASTFNGWKKTSGTATTAAGEFISIDGTDSTSNTAYGTLYNYYAASGGTISGDTNSNNASYDICPAGWRLPTGNSYGEFQALYENSSYNTQEKLRAPIANGGAAFTIAGYFYSGKPPSSKNYGSFWASTRFSDTKMFELSLDKSGTAGGWPVKANYAYSTRGNGISIRCIMKKPTHILTVSYGTGVTNISINGITVSNGGTISLEQGVKYLIKANLSTSYGFSSWSATSGTVGLASAQTTTYAIESSNATLTASATYVSTIIQNLPQSNCTTTASYAKDNRDNRIYTIKRLADGNCWMIDNLDLGRTTLTTNLTSANTNLVTTVTASTFNGWKKTKSTQNYTTGEFLVTGEFDPANGDPGDTDLASGSGYGVSYNYCAVSAGTICTNSNSSNASSDLCPAGWRLPTGSWSSGSSEFKDLYTQYNSSYDLMRAPVTSGGAAFPLSGGFFYLTYSGATAQMGTFGSWWAATRYSNLTMFILYMNINSAGTKSVQLSTDDRYRGSAARCIMKTVPSHVLTVSYGTGISNVKINNIIVQNGGMISLNEGASYSITMTPSASYSFSSWSVTSGTIGSTSTQTTTYMIGSSNATITATASFSGPNMQNFPQSSCTTIASQVKDTRDNHIYTIKRLADGSCWMMENLDLGRTTLSTNLTSSNTNLSTTITASTFNGWKKTSGTGTYDAGEFINVTGTDSTSGTPYGTLYNFYAASAGTISGSSNGSNATYDICPAGWRLPTGGSSGEFQTLYAEYNSNALMRASIENNGAAFALAGYFRSGAPASQGSVGYYWSSARYNNTGMHTLNLDTSSVSPAYSSGNLNGLAIRCVLKGTKISDLTYLQDFRSLSADDKFSILTSMADNTTYNLIDNRDNKTYAVAKLKDGKIWLAENLDLGRTTLSTNLTSSNTNVSTTVTASTFNSWKKTYSTVNYTSGEFMPVDGIDPTSGNAYGMLYNFCAASAGTICTSSNSSNASYDICPAGWRLPTGGYHTGEFYTLSAQYNNEGESMRAPIASGGAAFATAGVFNGSAQGYPGYTPAYIGYGYYWSSTRYNDTRMYRLHIYNYAYPDDAEPSSNGFSLRCVVK